MTAVIANAGVAADAAAIAGAAGAAGGTSATAADAAVSRRLDEALAAWRGLSPLRPGRGWLRAIRRTLGMTTRQAAARVGVSQAALVDAERNEAGGDITLATLQRYAAALDCRLYYALVPRRPLQEAIEGRAEELARAQAGAPAGPDQGAAPADVEALVEDYRRRLLSGRRSRLWQ